MGTIVVKRVTGTNGTKGVLEEVVSTGRIVGEDAVTIGKEVGTTDATGGARDVPESTEEMGVEGVVTTDGISATAEAVGEDAVTIGSVCSAIVAPEGVTKEVGTTEGVVTTDGISATAEAVGEDPTVSATETPPFVVEAATEMGEVLDVTVCAGRDTEAMPELEVVVTEVEEVWIG